MAGGQGSDEAKGLEPASYQTRSGSTVTAGSAVLMEKGAVYTGRRPHWSVESRRVDWTVRGGRDEPGPSGDSTHVC